MLTGVYHVVATRPTMHQVVPCSFPFPAEVLGQCPLKTGHVACACGHSRPRGVGGGALRFEWVPTAKRLRGAEAVNAKI